MSDVLLTMLGRPSYINGSLDPVQINIEHGVQLAGMGSEQATYRGDYVAERDVATISISNAVQINDTFVQDGVEYRLENRLRDNGANRRFIISKVRTV